MKTVFITGANRGIGLALCKKFATEMNYKVYMGVRDLEKAKKALDEIDNPSNIVPIIIDVEFESSIANAYQEYLKIKSPDEQLDLFINNAGAQLDWIPNGEYIKTLDIDVELLDKIFRINVFASVLTTRYFLHSMKKGARIVNVASGSGEFWDPNASLDFQPGYATSKSALIMMTKKLAAAVSDKGIYVNSCCPGWCRTSMGGNNADTSPDDGANSVIATCFLNELNPPSGKHFRYGDRIMLDVIPSYFCENCDLKEKVKLIQKIFSLKNEGKHKVLRILGFKIKMKRKNK